MQQIWTKTMKSAGAKIALTLLSALALLAGAAVVYAAAKPSVPAPVITAAPGAQVNSTSASFSFTDSQPRASFQCSLDDAAFAACTSPKAYTVAAGSHTFAVRAVADGRYSSATSRSWRVDTTPPQAPWIGGMPSDPSGSSSATFLFSHAEAGVSFECRLDSGAYTVCTSSKSYSGLALGAHGFSVRARDAAGNIGIAASYTWQVVPPAPVISSKPVSPTNQTTATFNFGQPLSSGMSAANVTFRCSLDGSAFAACTSPKSYQGLAPGSHSFQVRAVSGSQQSSATSYSWLVDTTAPPAPAITAKPAALSNETSARFSFTDPESGAGFRCKLDGGAYAPCSSPTYYGNLAQGSHGFSVQATDAAGNVSAAAAWAWKVDTVRPSAPTITQHPADPSPSATTTFAWTGSEAGLSFQCSRENGPWQSCSSPYTYVVTPSNDEHKFRVRAVDGAGNVSDHTTFKWKLRDSSPVRFEIAGSVSGLVPGLWRSIPVMLTNPNSAAIYVTALTVGLPAASVPGGCSPASNLELQQASGLGAAPVRVPANGSVVVPAAQQPRLRLRNLTTNQDVCKGKSFTLAYSGTAGN